MSCNSVSSLQGDFPPALVLNICLDEFNARAITVPFKKFPLRQETLLKGFPNKITGSWIAVVPCS